MSLAIVIVIILVAIIALGFFVGGRAIMAERRPADKGNPND